MPEFLCPEHPAESRRFEIPEGDDAGREFYYPCGRRVTGADEHLFTDAGKPVPYPTGSAR